MDFKTQLKALVPELFRLDNENFIKEINGEQITSTDLFEYFRVRMESSCLNSLLLSCLELLCCLRFGNFTNTESYA
jgi:hypothetical protein